MDALNPYAPPAASLQAEAVIAEGKYWREGKQLVVRDQCKLPARCIKCGAAAPLAAKPRKFYWHSPAWYLLILLSILIYAIAALIVRKKVEVTLGLCAGHSQRRKLGIAACLAGIAGGFVLLFAGLSKDSSPMMLAGPLLVLAGIICGLVFGRLMTPARIDHDFARFNGCSPAFLALLPVFRNGR
ncbi:MAG: hypothetical protein ACREO7_10965 [Pseudoxanthomonas sp.]